MKLAPAIVALLLLAAFLGGCDFQHEKGQPPSDEQRYPAPPLEPTYRSIRANLFEMRCFHCHKAESDLPRLDTLDEVLHSRDELVTPGDPENSWLVMVVSGRTRKMMPPRSSPFAALTPQEIEVIKTWIANGTPE